MAVTASFNSAARLLSVFGDSQNNNIRFSRDAAGRILINGGAVTILGDDATVANTSLIQAFGQAGDDIISVDETNGAMPPALLFGGDGNDTLTGGSAADQLFGQAGNDTLLGKGGNDLLFGGDGNDTLIGGAGDDQVFGQAGNDLMIWNPGDGSDLFEGGDGIDTAQVNGGNGAENFTISANGTRVVLDRVSPAPFTIDIGTTENLVVNANGGDDVITAGNGLAGLINLTIDGGAGNDTITGGDGNDTLIGGDGNDLINGGRGNDVSFLGAGDDTFVWNPGDGSDTVEGEAGNDMLQFNGANVNEKVEISANGSRVRFTRDVANITMDLNSIENINFVARGGADTITVDNLVGTGVKQVNLDLSNGVGGGDGSADTVIVNGSDTKNVISVIGNGTSFSVNGLPWQVNVTGSEGANDRLVINALGGNDTIDASGLSDGVVQLTIDAGAGNDTIIGSRGADVLIGGDGNDVVTGGAGNDVAFLGSGDDTFVWNPGDGSDVVEGQDGTDTLLFNGSNAAENVNIFANGSRVAFTRDVANVTMDLNGIEHIQFRALGGADNVTVGDLSGTGVTQVSIDLAGFGGISGDGAADTVTVNGTAGNDTITVAAVGTTMTVNGLPAQVVVSHVEAANDSLVVNGGAGDDSIDASSVAAGDVNLTLNGGDGNDLIVGSAGNDMVNGGRGNDTALMGDGNDTFVWNPGDGSDIVEGQGGFDTMLFNGANVNENIGIFANGTRALFTRDVANITMDLNGVENIQFTARGGSDTINVGDLTGTNVQQVGIDLSGVPGTGVGDGSPDTVIINGTAGNDVITVTDNGNGVITVSGLAEQVTITGFEAANDHLVINGLGGDDVIQGSLLSAGVSLTADGGDGNDVLLGGAGNDTLLGGAGDDVLNGGPGLDVLDGGTGDNVLIQDSGFAAVGSASAATAAFAPVPSLVYSGTAGADTISVTQSGATVNVAGGGAPASFAADGSTLTVSGLAGDDVIDASSMTAPAMRFILDGGDGNDLLHGGQGDDVLRGGAGADTFAFSGSNGSDTIADFQHGLDQIVLQGYGAALSSFADLAGHMAQVGNDVQVNLGAGVAGAGMITLQNTQLAAVTASDFRFS